MILRGLAKAEKFTRTKQLLGTLFGNLTRSLGNAKPVTKRPKNKGDGVEHEAEPESNAEKV